MAGHLHGVRPIICGPINHQGFGGWLLLMLHKPHLQRMWLKQTLPDDKMKPSRSKHENRISLDCLDQEKIQQTFSTADLFLHSSSSQWHRPRPLGASTRSGSIQFWMDVVRARCCEMCRTNCKSFPQRLDISFGKWWENP